MKINPIRSSKPVNQLLDEFFDRSLSDIFDTNFSSNTPSANIIEEKDSFKIELAVPGLEKDDIQLSLEKDHLTVSYQKEVTDDQGGENFKRREFNFSSFKRSFYLPEAVDKEAIDARYEQGILIIELSKMESAQEQAPRVIDIR